MVIPNIITLGVAGLTNAINNSIQSTNQDPFAMFRTKNTGVNLAHSNSVLSNNAATMQDEFINSQQKPKKLKSALLIGSAISATAAFGIYLFKKHKLPKNITPSNPDLNTSKFELFDSSDVKKVLSSIYEKEKIKLESSVRGLDEYGFSIVGKRKKIPNFENLQHLVASEKIGIRIGEFTVPDIVLLKGVDENSHAIQDIVASSLGFEVKSLKYAKNDLTDFMQYFEKFKSKAPQNDVRRFLNIENFSDFLDDIKQTGAKNEQSIFADFIENCSIKNKVTIIADSKIQSKLSEFSARGMVLDFTNKIDMQDLTSDVSTLESMRLGKSLRESAMILNELKIKPENNSNLGLYIEGHLSKMPDGRSISIVSASEKQAEEFIEDLSSQLGAPFVKIDLVEGLGEKLLQTAQKAEKRYQITGEETFLYLKNTKKSSELQDFLNTCYEKYHIKAAYNNAQNASAERLNCDSISFNLPLLSSDFKKIQQGMLDLMQQNDFSFLPDNEVKTIQKYISTIASEQSGIPVSEDAFQNIILMGSRKVVGITANSLKKTLNINNASVNIDASRPHKILEDVTIKLNEAEAVFKNTGKRTLLELENLDELLTNDTTSESRSLIGKIKGILENSNQKYHTTILMKTDKALDAFEEASIGDQRFGLKIKLNERV